MKFKIGEIAVLVSDKNGRHPETIGWEVEIKRRTRLCDYDYVVADNTGKEWVANECELRKKKPPKEETSWEKVHEIIGWKPEEVTV